MNEGHWQCKKHGKGCQSYVNGIVIPSLNAKGITPENISKANADDLELVEWVKK